MLVKAYQQSYSLPVIVCRGNNVYGPRQYPEKVVPKFIHRALRGLPMCIHGEGTQLRSYLFVDDVAQAFDTILHRGATGEIYNIGTDDEISIRQLAEQVCDSFKCPRSLIEHVEDRRFNDQRYRMDASKLRDLGWAPSTSWTDGFAQTCAWYCANCGYWNNIEAALLPHPRVAPKLQPPTTLARIDEANSARGGDAATFFAVLVAGGVLGWMMSRASPR